ncbi:sphinganine-1-phosphate aldolase [Tremella mesenterica]|uniref:sphinganine-1-phosphate aldolase n=1 Tax=Tremella mesenterica TaxID=5217 RepID=A0A4Q1BKI5_TREME|nr:sphinganine-1-phosphate aldolase [Tremella mesenterica]
MLSSPNRLFLLLALTAVYCTRQYPDRVANISTFLRPERLDIGHLHHLFIQAAQLYLVYSIFLILHSTLLQLRAEGILTYFCSIYSYCKALLVKWGIKQEAGDVKHASVSQLPEHGRSREWLEEEWTSLKRLQREHATDGRISGTVYHGGEELNRIIIDAMSEFLLANPLHTDIFLGVRKMEAEIISMCLHLFNGPNGAGTTTSGGTESILMSIKTHRDWARQTKGVTKPEMVIPSSAHAAFWKGAEYFGVKLHVIPVNPTTRQADVRRMRRAINGNTIMIVGSAPNFPDGIIDPIPELAALAERRGIGLHVDCCLGSFLMPFLGRAGLDEGVPSFDFKLPGVTAISCDIHKYAFCPKGSSVIMYRSKELRRYQYYVITDWAGGVYASPSLAGSRPGAILAGAWAVLNHIGLDGYTASCREIVTASRTFAEVLRAEFPDLYILGEPKLAIVAFGARSKSLDIYAVGDALSKKGWHLNALANPPALHMAFTHANANSVSKLTEDLQTAISSVKASPPKNGDLVALYGLGQTSVGPHVVGRLAELYLDTMYE